MQALKDLVAEVPDFPQPGILFRDISPLLRLRFRATMSAVDALFSAREWSEIDAIAGVESRGFILASATRVSC
jgi:adenine phosphoribosyltransferase